MHFCMEGPEFWSEFQLFSFSSDSIPQDMITVLRDWDHTSVHKYYVNRVSFTQHSIYKKCCYALYQAKINCSFIRTFKWYTYAPSFYSKKWKSRDHPRQVGLGLSKGKCCRKPKMSDFFSVRQLRLPAILQPLEIQGCTVSHLKFLILEQFTSA